MRFPADSEPNSKDLYLEGKFATNACQVGEQMETDFTRFKWCKKNLMNLIDQCTLLAAVMTSLSLKKILTKMAGDAEDAKWARGGMMLALCVQWNIAEA